MSRFRRSQTYDLKAGPGVSSTMAVCPSWRTKMLPFDLLPHAGCDVLRFRRSDSGEGHNRDSESTSGYISVSAQQLFQLAV